MYTYNNFNDDIAEYLDKTIKYAEYIAEFNNYKSKKEILKEERIKKLNKLNNNE